MKRGKKYNNYFSSKLKLGINSDRRYTDSALTKIKSSKDILHKHKYSYFNDVGKKSRKRESNASIKSHDSNTFKKNKSRNYGSNKNLNFFSRKKAISTKQSKIVSPYTKRKFEKSKNNSPSGKSKYKYLGYKFSRGGKKGTTNTSRYSKDYSCTEKRSLKTDRLQFSSKFINIKDKKNKKSLSRIKSLHLKDSRKGFLSIKKTAKYSPQQEHNSAFKGIEYRTKQPKKEKMNNQIIKKLIDITTISGNATIILDHGNDVSSMNLSRKKSLGKLDSELAKLKLRINDMIDRNDNLITLMKDDSSFASKNYFPRS